MTKPTGRPVGRPRKNDVTRDDGAYENAFLSVGTNRDRGTYTRPNMTAAPLDMGALERLYSGDGFARRIVDLPAEEMTRAGYDLDGLEETVEGRVKSLLETVGALPALCDAARWARLYGGALIVMLVDDGSADLLAPLDVTKARGLEKLRVYDRTEVTRGRMYSDPADKRFGQVETWQINPSTGMPYAVHETRCLRFDGAAVPNRVREQNEGWGASVLQQCHDQLTRFGMSHYWANGLLERAQQAVHSISGLSSTLRGKGGSEMIRQRVDLVDMVRGINNTVVIDGDGETYELKATSLTGVADLIDRFGKALSAVTGLPETLLFGAQQKGLGNSGAGDLENWYASVSQDQENILLGPLDTLVQIALYAVGSFTPDYLIEFEPLYVPSDKEKAEVEKLEAEAKKTKADAANLYVTMQALDPSEVRAGLGEEYEIDPVKLLAGPDLPEPAPAPVDPAAAPMVQDAAPRPLYVSRKVLNVADLKAWAKGQGLPELQDDLHVTVAYSRKPLDWMAAGTSWQETVTIPAGGPRLVEPLGGQTAVLLFTCDDLIYRHSRIIEAGASYDWPEYQPHISLTKEPLVELEAVEPYRGAIELGPEIFEELNDS